MNKHPNTSSPSRQPSINSQNDVTVPIQHLLMTSPNGKSVKSANETSTAQQKAIFSALQHQQQQLQQHRKVSSTGQIPQTIFTSPTKTFQQQLSTNFLSSEQSPQLHMPQPSPAAVSSIRHIIKQEIALAMSSFNANLSATPQSKQLPLDESQLRRIDTIEEKLNKLISLVEAARRDINARIDGVEQQTQLNADSTKSNSFATSQLTQSIHSFSDQYAKDKSCLGDDIQLALVKSTEVHQLVSTLTQSYIRESENRLVSILKNESLRFQAELEKLKGGLLQDNSTSSSGRPMQPVTTTAAAALNHNQIFLPKNAGKGQTNKTETVEESTAEARKQEKISSELSFDSSYIYTNKPRRHQEESESSSQLPSEQQRQQQPVAERSVKTSYLEAMSHRVSELSSFSDGALNYSDDGSLLSKNVQIQSEYSQFRQNRLIFEESTSFRSVDSSCGQISPRVEKVNLDADSFSNEILLNQYNNQQRQHPPAATQASIPPPNLSMIKEQESEEEEIVYQVDDEGFLLNEQDEFVLDISGLKIRLKEDQIDYLRANNILCE